MKNAQARTTYLKDYRPPAFLIQSTDLFVDLYEDHALVRAKLLLKRNADSGEQDAEDLVLNGRELELRFLSVADRELGEGDYLLDGDTLSIPQLNSWLEEPTAAFVLECHTRIEPQNNTALEGLYKSKTLFCTQCEAEGFRRITYYLDRPDVMSVFTTTIAADKNKYPILLSNGNRIASGSVANDGSRHWVKWEDPFKKPSYLFALVAGDLVSLDDSFRTMSGREVSLQIFVEEKDIDKCDHAMASLRRAMRWDEEVYGREYDLDIFMIVAVDDFNMGAMENKGLNIFNTSCVLANPRTATDQAFQRVEAVVAHEYFHNWSGNRVTCRDWFQLSLKEGFTVFRDAEFSADMGSRTVKRVEDVAFLKTVQFAEDGGPMAHAVRPDSYMEIANFYTVTIYEKGAEVVRMISHLLGPKRFRAGCDLYFRRHDGQAVTTEEFVCAMEEVSGIDLTQFRRWYDQAGTPVVEISGNYDSSTQEYALTVNQHCPPTPGQTSKRPFYIPLRMGLLNADGEELPLIQAGQDRAEGVSETVLVVAEECQEFRFRGIEQEPVPSLLRGFSAPVRLHFDYSPEQLLFLMVHDSDGFNRWYAAQELAMHVIRSTQQGERVDVPHPLLQRAYENVIDKALGSATPDLAMVAHLLSLPSEGFLIEQADVADPEAIHGTREELFDSLAHTLRTRFEAVFAACDSAETYRFDADSVARRALKNLALAYLVRSNDSHWLEACKRQFDHADNMTDQLAALRCLANNASTAGRQLADAALEAFYAQWQDEPLVVDQWFAAQATRTLPGTLEKVQELMGHPAFELRNPNKVRSLIGAFCAQNHIGFHMANGAGYEFLADRILELDQLNPQIAARSLTPLTRWQKFDPPRQALMQAQLQRIKASPGLSKDVFEVVEKSTVGQFY